MKDIVKESAIKYAKTATLEVELFKKFANDYFNLGPKEALENLKGKQATEKTIAVAKDFHKDVLQQYDAKIQEFITSNEKTPEIKKEILMMEFYKDYLTHNDHNRAYRTAMEKVQKDPELASDKLFQEVLVGEHKKLEPVEKKGRNGMAINPDKDLLFSVRNTGRQKYQRKLNNKEVRELITGGLRKHLAAHLAGDFGLNPEMANKINVDFEVSNVMSGNAISPSFVLASKDLEEMSAKAVSVTREVNNEIKSKNLKSAYNEKQFKEELKQAYKKPSIATPTELMQILKYALVVGRNRGAEEGMTLAMIGLKKQLKLEGKRITDPSKIKDLIDIVDKHREKIGEHLSSREARDLMVDAYGIFMNLDKTDQGMLNNVHKEVKAIMNKGEVTATSVLAVEEIERKRRVITQWNVYSKVLNAGIGNGIGNQNDMKAEKVNISGEKAEKKKISVNPHPIRQHPPSQDIGPGFTMN